MADSNRRDCQALVVCEMCESYEDVIWRCNTCPGDLCTKCKNTHKQRPIFRQHSVITRREAMTQGLSEKCPSHPEKSVILFCDNCTKFTCPTCLTEGHSGHKLSEINTVMDSVRQKLTSLSDEIKNNLMEKCDQENEKINRNIEACEEWYSSVDEQVNERRSLLKTAIDQICDDIVEKASKEREQLILDMAEANDCIYDIASTISQLGTSIDEVLIQSNLEQIKFAGNITEIDVPSIRSPRFPKFIPAEADFEQIATTMVGRIEFQNSEIPKEQETGDKQTSDSAEEGRVVVMSLDSEEEEELDLKGEENDLLPLDTIQKDFQLVTDQEIPQVAEIRVGSGSPTVALRHTTVAETVDLDTASHRMAGPSATVAETVDLDTASHRMAGPSATVAEIVDTQQTICKADNIVPAGDMAAWISKVYSQQINNVSFKGQSVKPFRTDFQVYDFIVLSNSNIITTDFWGQCIRVMSAEGEVTSVTRTDPCFPSGICLCNSEQDIAVCMYHSNNYRSTLAIYTLDLMFKQTIQYTDKLINRWYVRQRVAQSNRGDYCITHFELKTVFVIDKDGTLRFQYNGSVEGRVDTENRFDPRDICCDNSNHIFISDIGGNCIHMLDHHGNIIQHLLAENQQIIKPTGLCIDSEGHLWVGYGENSLCVVRYNVP